MKSKKKPVAKYMGSRLAHTVALIRADEVRPDGTLYPASVLRAQAEANHDFAYDEKTKTLYYRMPHPLEDIEETPKAKVPVAIREITLNTSQQWHVDATLRDIADDTNAKYSTVMVEYTKVWAFLRTIIQSDSLKASVLLDALNEASTVSNDELVQLSDYSETSKLAHGLLATYFLKK